MTRIPTFVACLLLSLAVPADAADPFLKVDGRIVRNDGGKGDNVPLRGVNLGSWLLFEGWMCPMDSSGLKDDFAVRETLTRRFGPAGAERLLATYQDTFLKAGDLDNIAALGMNVVRLPFWNRTFRGEDGFWRLDGFDRMDWLIREAWARGSTPSSTSTAPPEARAKGRAPAVTARSPTAAPGPSSGPRRPTSARQ